MHDLDQTIRNRRSVRGFLPKEVPDTLLRECLTLAQYAPSNCNVQPWRVYIASGAARDKLRDELVSAVREGRFEGMESPIDSFPGTYRDKQISCAVEMYGHMGVGRGDKEGRDRAFLRNYELFDAPHVAFVCMDKSFGIGVALDVGMYVQTLMLLLSSRGIGSCAQASLRSHPKLVRGVLDIPENEQILCGLSFGYEDDAVPVNRTRQPRAPLEENVFFRR
jgi:nitroreductase